MSKIQLESIKKGIMVELSTLDGSSTFRYIKWLDLESRRSRRSYPFPSGSARRKEYLSPSKGIIDLDEKTRSFIRRIALSTLIAAGKPYNY